MKGKIIKIIAAILVTLFVTGMLTGLTVRFCSTPVAVLLDATDDKVQETLAQASEVAGAISASTGNAMQNEAIVYHRCISRYKVCILWLVSFWISQSKLINWAFCTELKKILMDEADEELGNPNSENSRNLEDAIPLIILRALLAWMWICIELAVFL